MAAESSSLFGFNITEESAAVITLIESVTASFESMRISYLKIAEPLFTLTVHWKFNSVSRVSTVEYSPDVILQLWIKHQK